MTETDGGTFGFEVILSEDGKTTPCCPHGKTYYTKLSSQVYLPESGSRFLYVYTRWCVLTSTYCK